MPETEPTVADLLAEIPHKGDVTHWAGYRVENKGSYTDACGLCSCNPACGYATVTTDDGTQRLCHTDDHSCYHAWTVWGIRPDALEEGAERD